MNLSDKEKAPRLLLLSIALCSTALGLMYLYSIREVPQLRMPVIDEWAYDHKALGVLNGTWPHGKVFYQDPLYPYFLAFIYWIIGHRILAVKVLQVLIGGLHVLLIYGISRRAFSRTTAVAAAVLAAFYKPLFFFEGILTKEILSLVLVDASLLALLWSRASPRKWPWFISGMLLGVASMTRANLLLLVPVWGLWIFFSVRSERAKDEEYLPSNYRFRRGISAAGLYIAGTIVALSPVTIHNFMAGDLVLLTSQGGQNFYIGNHPGNQSGTYLNPPFVRAHPMFEEEDFERASRTVRDMVKSPSAISRFWYEMSFNYMRDKPREFWRNMAFKAALYFNDYEESDNVNYYFYRDQFSRILRLPLPGYGIMVVFGVFGWLALLMRRGRGGGEVESGGTPILLFLPVYALSTIAYYIFARYRVPVLAVMAPLSAYGLRTLWELAVKLNVKKLILSLAILGGLWYGAFYPIKQPRFDVAEFQLANSYRNIGRYDLAEREYRKAIFLSPDTLPYRQNLGLLLYNQSKYEEAEKEFLKAIDLFPRNPTLRESLANTYARMGRMDDAILQYELAINYGGNSARLFYNTYLAYKSLGFRNPAELYLKKTFETDPEFKP